MNTSTHDPGRIAVSIINYRTGDMTIAAVQSVLDDLGERDGDVIVIDNASGDGSAELIADWITAKGDSRIRLIQSNQNSGFSGGHNQGMAAAPDAEFYLVLNSDALLRPGFFDAMLLAANRDPKVGLIAPQLEYDDGEVQISCFRFTGPISEIIRGAATGVVTKFLKRHVIAIPNPPAPELIEWASFACILLRAKMVREIGPMDEGYFLYFEDAEYTLRARRAKWNVVHTAQARAVHFRGGSGPVKQNQSEKKRLPVYYWRSRTRFLRQAHGVSGPFLGNLGWMLGRTIAQARRLTHSAPHTIHEHEWCDIWTGFWNPLKPDVESRG